MDTEKLLNDLKKEDPAALACAVKNLTPLVYAHLKRYRISEAESSSLCIDFLLAFIDRLQRKPLTLKTANFETYAKRACYFIWLRRRKRELKESADFEALSIYEQNDVLEVIEVAEINWKLQTALAALDKKCQIIVENRLFRNSPWHSIADLLGGGHNNIRRKGNQCLERYYQIWNKL